MPFMHHARLRFNPSRWTSLGSPRSETVAGRVRSKYFLAGRTRSRAFRFGVAEQVRHIPRTHPPPEQK